jgi:hypothetical protein
LYRYKEVQDAINQSRNLFQRKVDKMEQGLLLKSWRGGAVQVESS